MMEMINTMYAQFQPAFEVILREEGGYSPKDNKNGAVHRGITQKSWNAIRKKHGGKWLLMPANVKDLTIEHTRQIYLEHYWQPSGAWRLRDQRLANAYIVNYINVRWGEATKAIQRAVGVKPDGVLGPISADAINRRNPNLVLKDMNVGIMQFYRYLAESDPAEYADDLVGWELRLKRIEEHL